MAATITETTIRIAKAGAKKMIGNYEFRPFPGTEFLPPFARSLYQIKKLADGTKYKVNVKANTCNCPFCLENGYCKHLEYIKDELAWEAARIAEWEAARA